MGIVVACTIYAVRWGVMIIPTPPQNRMNSCMAHALCLGGGVVNAVHHAEGTALAFYVNRQRVFCEASPWGPGSKGTEGWALQD